MRSERDKEVFLNPKARMMLAGAFELFFSGRTREAERSFRLLMERFPRFYPGLVGYGDFLLHLGRPGESLYPLRRAVRLAVCEGVSHYLLGVAYLKVNRFFLAEQAFSMASRFLPEENDISTHLGRARMMLGDVHGAREYIEKSLKKDATNAYIYMDMAQTYMQTRDFETAEKWMASARALAPDDLFIRESIQAAEGIKRVFNELSKEEREKQKGVAISGDYIRETRLNLLLNSLKMCGGSEEDLFEITEELKHSGLSGQITVFKNSDSPEGKIAMGYVREHERFAVPGRKLTARECLDLSECLFSDNVDIREKKRVLVILASSGTARALRVLERFSKEADSRLKVWIGFALQECRSLLESRRNGAPAIVIHRLNS